MLNSPPPPPRIIALGQAAAGDDGAALKVMELLQKVPPEQAERVVARDASQLLELLKYPGPVWIVDALVGAPTAGELLELQLHQLLALPSSSVSSHGVDVAQAAQLCQTLYPGEITRELCFFAICIEPPSQLQEGLSVEVQRAVRHCAQRIRQRLLATAAQ